MSVINVGVIGFGTIGTGVCKVLIEKGEFIKKRTGITLKLKKVCDIDLEREREIKLEKSILTKDALELIEDPEISIVVELIGGYEPARTYVLKAIEHGKSVVTANKAMLSRYGREIFEAASKFGVDIRFEASVGGGIPVIRSVTEGFSANRTLLIYGILNGTSNYILTKMTEEGRDFSDVLLESQKAGYAEADPTLDVEGIDAAQKISILTFLAHGVWSGEEEIYTEGISKITPLDIEFAKEMGMKIKLLAISKLSEKGLEVRVHPAMIPKSHLLASVDGAYNAIFIVGDVVGQTMLYGMGAGMMPTASAVVSDIIELARAKTRGVSQRVIIWKEENHIPMIPMDEVVNRYYLRFYAVDRPGVLSKISGVLGDHSISISSVVQKGRVDKGTVPIFMMTHEARERDIKRALSIIDGLDVIEGKTMLIRVAE